MCMIFGGGDWVFQIEVLLVSIISSNDGVVKGNSSHKVDKLRQVLSLGF